ncbi:oxygen-independent coproporphyrinogen III oxidase [Marinimicrobium sp. ABcell2]|uniref:oxygen-independent coproporphyrinogen III oxidase n=1 Tax=Marinimicrobium sp. ABcell2 TaxID=3069751 RepID=UPI0027B7155C|nr:oxygen-independent coproporphyrinogen III oxidase [Marinimicrobium sp. ABcell2]MDQ2076414.1 oxygen-independent coproporphyrinogen III oxidase [Marinimicrobium sp. ABcell2]
MPLFTGPLLWDHDLIQQYDLSGPRYTSYPTAPQFRDSFTDEEFQAAVAKSNLGGKPLSLYFHIPFCETLCFYCGCNKVVTNNTSRAKPYLERVAKEMAQQAQLFDTSRPVTQLHWGGGTPTYISDDEMTWLMEATRRHFSLVDDDQGEYSVEIHPGKVSASTMAHLRKLGFNRVSMGVQDFNPRVQKAVNRYNSVQEVSSLVSALREQDYRSISMDLIYGLPLQTLESVRETLDQVIDLSPDRLSLFNYAHMPHLFKSQSLIHESDLPSPSEKLGILHMAIERLQAAGYVYIGMDHFAKPDDSLVLAQQAGELQRNFQGYSTHGHCDLLSFGVSSISSFGDVYLQNAKRLDEYHELLDSDQRPAVRGFTLSEEDKLRQWVINQLICHFQLDFAEVKRRFGVDPTVKFAQQLEQLAPMVEDGLLSLDAQGIHVHNSGRLLIRRICMVFDEYLNASSEIRYSKVI